MKFLVILSAVVAAAFAKPQLLAAGPIAPGLLASPALGYIGHPLAYSAYASPALAYSAGPSIAYTAAAPALYSAAPAPSVISRAVAPVVAAAPAVVAAPATIKSQYHAQDELGNTAFGHSEPGQVHTSVQDAAGNRVGSFSYLNPTDGQIHRTDYVADAAGGYRVAANDLPLAPAAVPAPVADTPEVVAARAAHLAAHARARRSVLLQTPASTAPLATPVAVAAPVVARTIAPVALHSAPLAYSAAAPLALSAAPLAYSSAPLAYSSAPLALSAAPAGIPATLTTIVNNPGHAVSYRID